MNKNSLAKNIILGIIVVVIALIIINVGTGGSITKNFNTATTKANTITHKKHELLSIVEVQQMLAENPVNVKNLYLNKEVCVSGVVNKIQVVDGENQYIIQSKDLNNLTYKDLNDSTIATYVIAVVSSNSKMAKQMSKIHTGSKVVVNGKVIKVENNYLALEVDELVKTVNLI
ncbi:OB-fold protein [Megasphaera elsdenii]|uniref:OB-fold protein n=1 Tax=Megasphaera elsdenii TaxID=907 RepID=UPI00091F84CF|nr:hypothetical protein [Megasphaera elsdenii]SHK40546.1 tRNA_anti-like [Megasphaera elsdenii]